MTTFINPDTQNLTNFGIQGMRVYGAIFDGTIYSTTLVDFGNIENLARARDVTENNLETSRNGIRSVVKPLTSAFAESFTFDTLNFGDPILTGLYEGSDALTMVAPTGKIIVRAPGAKKQIQLFILKPGAPGTDSTLLMIPKAQIEGADETESNGTDAGRLGFKVTLLLDEAYKVPAAVLASNDSAPYGVRGILEASANPIADLHALIDALRA